MVKVLGQQETFPETGEEGKGSKGKGRERKTESGDRYRENLLK